MAGISVNKISFEIVKRILSSPERLGVRIVKLSNGTTIIDMGVHARGGFEAGALDTEICLGGLGTAQLTMMPFEDLTLPAIVVTTNWPAISTLGCQAGYPLVDSVEDELSGPARALALKPRELYEFINYKDESDVAVINLQGDFLPSKNDAESIAAECKVEPKNLYILVTPGGSVAGATQIAGRVMEDVTLTMHEILHYDVNKVRYMSGVAPIAPACIYGMAPKTPKLEKALPDDLISYGGKVFLALEPEPKENLRELAKKLVFESTPIYGRTFYELLEKADFSMRKVPGFPDLFRPAEVVINDVKTGRIYRAGEASAEMVKKCLRTIV